MKKLQKKAFIILSVIAAVCILSAQSFTMVFSASTKTPCISVSSAGGKAGDTVDVTITMSDNPGFVSANLYVNYDTKVLTLKKVKDGGLLSGVTHSDNYTSPYGLCWINDLATENFKVNGVMATLTFEISKEAKQGKTTLSLEQDILNCDIENVVFTLNDGIVEVGNSSAKSDNSDSSSDNSQNSENKSSDKTDSSNNSDNGSDSVSESSDNSSSVSDVNNSEKSESGNSEVSSESNSESDLSSATSDSAQNQGSGPVVLWLVTGGLILVAVLIFIGAFVYKKRKNQAE